MNEADAAWRLGQTDVPYIETSYILVDPNSDEQTMDALLEPAARLLQTSMLVAMPTETVYGLAANALDEEAVRRIYLAKGRPQDNPMIVHVDSVEAMLPLVQSWSIWAERLAERFMPGPLTLILPKSDLISNTVSGGLDTVGLRMPSHPVARRLLRLSGLPLAAPSANRSGRPSPTEAAHVLADLDSRIDCIIDGGTTTVGLESTVLDLTAARGPRILRPGAVTFEDLSAFFLELREEDWPFQDEDWMSWLRGDSLADLKADDASIVPRSPGMKYRHYAPRAAVVVLRKSDASSWSERIQAAGAKRVGLYASRELVEQINSDDFHMIHCFGSRERADLASHDLFMAFRAFDEAGCEMIFAEELDEHDLGRAYMNRLNKAASGINKVKNQTEGDDYV